MEESIKRKICACISEKNFSECMALASKHSFAEIRGDICLLTLKDIETLISQNLNLIFTYRFDEYGREIALNQMVAAINKGVAYVDVDVSADREFIERIREEIDKKPQPVRCKLILSYHNFSETPSLEKMKEAVAECVKKGADIVKIAVTANNISEASRVLSLYHCTDLGVDREHLIAFSMGDIGRFTRIAIIGMGAPFTYCSVGNPTGAGQYTVTEMYKELLGVAGSGAFSQVEDASKSELFSRFCQKSLPTARKKKGKSISIPCSKSIAQRAIVAAAIASGQTILRNFEPCGDIKSAVTFARKCGCVIKISRDGKSSKGEKMLIIRSAGIAKWKYFQIADVGESGLLTRLLMPIMAYVSSIRNKTAVTSKITLVGEETLLKRDISSAVAAVKKSGAVCMATKSPRMEGEFLPITISGGITEKNFTISGNESSQTVSGFLMVLPLLKQDTTMVVENPVSTPFIDLTIDVLRSFGIKIGVTRKENKFIFNIAGNQSYHPVDFFMDSDWSSASNFVAAGAIATFAQNGFKQDETLTINNMEIESDQADEKIISVVESCGAEVDFEKTSNEDFAEVAENRFHSRRDFSDKLNNVSVKATSLKPFNVDVTNSPDLFPILATLAVYCNGVSRINGVSRLIKKESNRAEAIILEFSRMGYCIEIEDDVMIINGMGGKTLLEKEGGENLPTIFCSAHNDHRIAMAVVICGMFRSLFNNTPSKIMIDNLKCIDKSFPTFMERLQITE